MHKTSDTVLTGIDATIYQYLGQVKPDPFLLGSGAKQVQKSPLEAGFVGGLPNTPAAHDVGGFDIELVKGVGMLRLEGVATR